MIDLSYSYVATILAIIFAAFISFRSATRNKINRKPLVVSGIASILFLVAYLAPILVLLLYDPLTQTGEEYENIGYILEQASSVSIFVGFLLLCFAFYKLGNLKPST